MSRIEKLKELYELDPNDEFTCYGLAMEYRAAERFEEAMKFFDQLVEREPPHVPSYFMKGQMLAEMDQIEDAKKVLTLGIEQANIQGNAHAAGEMTELLMTL